MKIALQTLLFNNPLLKHGIPVGLSRREVRNVIEELEMHATLGDDDPDLAYDRQVLRDPEGLMECELLATWGSGEIGEPLAREHDNAVTQLRELLQRNTIPVPGTAEGVIKAWTSVIEMSDFGLWIQRRLRELEISQPADVWIVERTGQAIFPAITRKALDFDVGMAVEIVDALPAAYPSMCQSSYEEAIVRIDPQFHEDRLEHLPVHYIVRLISKVDHFCVAVKPVAPEMWSQTMSSLVSSALRVASARAYSGDASGARAITAELLTTDLPQADAIQVRSRAAYFG